MGTQVHEVPAWLEFSLWPPVGRKTSQVWPPERDWPESSIPSLVLNYSHKDSTRTSLLCPCTSGPGAPRVTRKSSIMGTNNSHCDSLLRVLLAQFVMWDRHGQTGTSRSWQRLAEIGQGQTSTFMSQPLPHLQLLFSHLYG